MKFTVSLLFFILLAYILDMKVLINSVVISDWYWISTNMQNISQTSELQSESKKLDQCIPISNSHSGVNPFRLLILKSIEFHKNVTFHIWGKVILLLQTVLLRVFGRRLDDSILNIATQTLHHHFNIICYLPDTIHTHKHTASLSFIGCLRFHGLKGLRAFLTSSCLSHSTHTAHAQVNR